MSRRSTICIHLSTHSVHQIVHAGEVRPHADLELVHGLLAADGVETCAGVLSSPPTLLLSIELETNVHTKIRNHGEGPSRTSVTVKTDGSVAALLYVPSPAISPQWKMTLARL